MSILPERLVEFFSQPSASTAEAIESIPADATLMAMVRKDEVHGAIVNIVDLMGVAPDVAPAPAQVVSNMGRVAQAETDVTTTVPAAAEVKTDPFLPVGKTVDTPTKDNKTSAMVVEPAVASTADDKEVMANKARELALQRAQSTADAAEHFERVLQDN